MGLQPIEAQRSKTLKRLSNLLFLAPSLSMFLDLTLSQDIVFRPATSMFGSFLGLLFYVLLFVSRKYHILPDDLVKYVNATTNQIAYILRGVVH